MITPECSDCGREKELREVVTGAKQYLCPSCESTWDEKSGPGKFLCRGCWNVRSCVCHHISYDPELVVPMCTSCHERLHREDEFLPNLTPKMGRKEAEAQRLVTVNGLAESPYEPVEDSESA